VSVQVSHTIEPISEPEGVPNPPGVGADPWMLEHLGRLSDVTHELLGVKAFLATPRKN
jgi:hypothetical protein